MARMLTSFWQTLPRPFFALAPMEDVTDFVFREFLRHYGGPQVYYTEFAQAGGVAVKRRDSMSRLLKHHDQRPIVAQIWGNRPEDYYQAVKHIREAGFDGVDINMGCPQHKITVKGCCAGLIRTPNLAVELITAAQEAAVANLPGNLPCIPVSVKTRASFHLPLRADKAEAWFSRLLACKPQAFIVHARSAEQQSEGVADWSYVRLAAKLRDALSPQTMLIGNGDVASRADGIARAHKFSCDGIMVGRGLFTNPLLFSGKDFSQLPREQKLACARFHLDLYEDFWGSGRNYEIMKKFFKIYLQGFEDAESLRERIMETHDYCQARELLNS